MANEDVIQMGDEPVDPERRKVLEIATGVVAGAGAASVVWPLVQSMNPSADVRSKATAEASLAGLAPGDMKTVLWQGKPVFVFHRTPEQVAAMQKSPGGKDPQPDAERTRKPEWLILVGNCTHLGCVPSKTSDGWFCPCHGSVYDNSGRILRGPAPANLVVPPYEFIEGDKILIGKA